VKRVLCVLALVLAGCGGSSGPAPPAPGPETSTSVTTAPAPAPAPTSTTQGVRTVPLGTEVRTALGNTITVHGIDTAVASRGVQPLSGRVFAAVDVGGCISSTSASAAEGPSPAFFELVLADDSRSRALTSGVKVPELRASRLAPGECVRGWITFEPQAGVKPVAVVFSASTLVRWTLP
jgi:hypothetical protein